LGALGLPIFSGAGSGLPYLFGPTGGYLLGFVIAALFSGRFIKYAGIKPALVFAIFCLSDLILLLSGAIWLKFYLTLNFNRAFLLGVAPFLAGDMLKALAATAIYLKLGNRACERTLTYPK
jgi:biotin transport system substrate-specific component